MRRGPRARALCGGRHPLTGRSCCRSPRYRERLISSAVSAVKVADACLVVVDAAARLTDERRDLLHSLVDTVATHGAEPWLVLNKMDLVHKRWRRAKRQEYEDAARSAYAGLEHVHAISAQHMVGVDALRDALFDAAKPGDWCAGGGGGRGFQPTLRRVGPDTVCPDRGAGRVQGVRRPRQDGLVGHGALGRDGARKGVQGSVCAHPSPPLSTLTRRPQYTYREVPYKVRQANKGWVERANGSLRVYQQLQVRPAAAGLPPPGGSAAPQAP